MSKTTQPKFKLGDIVRFNNEKLNEMKVILENLKKEHDEDICNCPVNKLHICNTPKYNGKTWIYDYEYGLGFTSEGSAQEEDIEYYN